MKIAVAADHGGFVLKNKIAEYLKEKGHEVTDIGCYDETSIDYPPIAKKIGGMVASGEVRFGIICCTSGEGVSIACNKVKGIRCGIGYDDTAVKFLRLHNHANMIAFGQKYMKAEDVLRRVDIFLETGEEGERHDRRVAQIAEMEK